ncbi:MAG: acyl-CoA dehydrogenase [Deltaproteobacteria bacterium]|nr:MAG: acyl-CoA dehydrogenase [Deltaproteobacteria bacterium]
MLGVNVPAELGGLGAGVVAYSLAVTQLAKACAATTVAVCVSNMVAEVIASFGTPEQVRTHVPRLVRGEYTVGAFALSEPGAGSDPGGMRTRARRDGNDWVIDGTKAWITSGTDAGLFVVWARTSEGSGTRGISCFLVPAGTPGLTVGKPERKMGLRGSTTTPLAFDGCRVPADALLGEEGRGFRVAMMALDGGRIGIASQALGIGRAALEAALAHARTRRQFGRPIGDFQAVQWRLADMATALDAAELLALQAAFRKERGLTFTREASMAKLFASERAVEACNLALDVLAGAGYRREGPAERYFRDVRVTTIYEGTSEVQRIVISRQIARRFGGAS